MLTIIDRNGPPEAQTCPAFLCETCHEPVYGNNGLVVWEPTTHVDHRPGPFTVWTVHKGTCDRAWEKAVGKHLSSRELAEFVQQLAYNVTNPFTEEPGVEYVAPLPSAWRLGHYPR